MEDIVLYSLHPDMIIPTFCGAVRAANEEGFWNIRELAASATRANVGQTIVFALSSCHPDDKLIKK